MDHNSKKHKISKNSSKILRSRTNYLFSEELYEKIGTVVLSKKVMSEKKMVNSIQFLLRSEF